MLARKQPGDRRLQVLSEGLNNDYRLTIEQCFFDLVSNHCPPCLYVTIALPLSHCASTIKSRYTFPLRTSTVKVQEINNNNKNNQPTNHSTKGKQVFSIITYRCNHTTKKNIFRTRAILWIQYLTVIASLRSKRFIFT